MPLVSQWHIHSWAMGLQWVHTDWHIPSAEVVSSCTYLMTQVIFVYTNKYVQRGNDDERQTHGERQRTLRLKGALNGACVIAISVPLDIR